MNVSIGPLVFISFKYEFDGRVTELKTPGSILNPENQKKVDGMFLWDTGATISCINFQIAPKLGLEFKGVTQIYTASGVVNANRYIASIILTETKTEKTTIFKRRQFVTEINLSSNIIGLIGMDIIGLGSFLVNYDDSTGNHTLQFSFPNLEKLNNFNFKNEADKQNKKVLKDFKKSFK